MSSSQPLIYYSSADALVVASAVPVPLDQHAVIPPSSETHASVQERIEKVLCSSSHIMMHQYSHNACTPLVCISILVLCYKQETLEPCGPLD